MKRTNTSLSRQSTLPLARASTYGSKRSRYSASSRKSRFQTSAMARFQGFGFPDKLQVKHRYYEYTAIATAGGAGKGSYQYRCNGMYDPNITSTGHQPLYFDSLSSIYDHFTVVRSYLKLTASTSSSNPQTVAVFINDDSTITPSTIETCIEQSSAKYAVVTADAPRTFYVPWDAKRTFGGSVLGNDNLQGSGSADPTEQSVYTIVAQAVDAAQATSVLLSVEIIYTAVWDEIRDIASS